MNRQKVTKYVGLCVHLSACASVILEGEDYGSKVRINIWVERQPARDIRSNELLGHKDSGLKAARHSASVDTATAEPEFPTSWGTLEPLSFPCERARYCGHVFRAIRPRLTWCQEPERLSFLEIVRLVPVQTGIAMEEEIYWSAGLSVA